MSDKAECRGEIEIVPRMVEAGCTMPRDQDHYSEQEAQQRFEKLIKVALNTKPKK